MKMSWLSLLRAIMNWLYFFSWFSVIASVIILVLIPFDDGIGITLFGKRIFNVHWSFYIVTVLAVIGYWLFLAMIYHLKKASYAITPYRFVDPVIQKHFYKAGLFCVIGSLVSNVPTYIYSLATKTRLNAERTAIEKVSLNLGFSFDSFIVIIAFGIFLIIISKVIDQSIQIQKENDLTI